ncbi:MAG: Asp-tRNA(Asn)/Glu-tRNA(Gln) amidotransferase subunit GatA [Thermoactinomyces sp.]
MSLLRESLKEIHKRLADRELSARDLAEESLRQIEQKDKEVGAFLLVDQEGAMKRAAELDEQLATKKERGILTALPAGIKDNMCTEGLTTTCASKLLANYVPIYNATVVDKLNAAGAIAMGKLNMDEFAMGSSTENSAFQLTRNPWDLERVPGGSSGGSAAAVAAGEVYFALGSDTGGSIRQPAAFCGVVGLKPTYGRVSRYGLVAFASSLDQIGPLTKNVEDAAYVLQAISGLDVKDSTSADVEVPDYLSALTGDIKGLSVGVPKEMMGEGVSEGVRARVQEAIQKLEQMGATIQEVSLPHSDYAVATYYLIAPAEASSNLARYDGVRYGVRKPGKNLLDMYLETRSQGFGSEVKRRIMLGTYALSSGYYDAYYLKAQKVRTLIRQDFERIFEKVDVIVGPTAPTTAFKIGEKVDDPLTMYMNDILTIPVNLAGLPAISVPCGLSDGLPVGLQIIGKAFDESTILRVAHAYEQETERLPVPPLGGIEE